MNQLKKSRLLPWLRATGLAAGLFAAALVAHAQNAIQAVTSSMQSGSEVVRIDLAQPLAAVPTGFVIQAPARIALDFQGVTNAIGRSAVEVNQGNLRSINVVQAGERTRLVLNLKQATAYRTEIQGTVDQVRRQVAAIDRLGGGRLEYIVTDERFARLLDDAVDRANIDWDVDVDISYRPME